MTRMLKHRLHDALVIDHCTVTDELHRWDMWDSLNVKDGISIFRIFGLLMPIALGGGIEALI